MGLTVDEALSSWSISTTTPTMYVEQGETPDYPVMSVYIRPIRPNLSKLLKAGFSADRSSYGILSIPALVVSEYLTAFDMPNGAFGVWGAAQKYDQSALEGSVVLSYDGFETISRIIPLKIEYIAGAGIDPVVVQGDDDTKAGTGVRTYSARIQPVSGLPYVSTDLSSGFSELNVQMGRVTINVLDANGDAVEGDTVKYEGTGELYVTDESGQIVLDAPPATLEFTGLRGSVTKSVSISAFASASITFQYGGIEGVIVDSNGRAVPGAIVDILESGNEDHFVVYTDEDGRYSICILKPNSTYIVTILNYWKSVQMLGEGTLITVNFNNALGWNVPAGYPPTPRSAFVIVKDEEGYPLYGVKVKLYDENLQFVVRTDLNGNAAIVVPATTWKLLIDGGKRFNSVEKDVDLSSAPYSETVILKRKAAISIR